jgi:hypothetical protein
VLLSLQGKASQLPARLFGCVMNVFAIMLAVTTLASSLKARCAQPVVSFGAFTWALAAAAAAVAAAAAYAHWHNSWRSVHIRLGTCALHVGFVSLSLP